LDKGLGPLRDLLRFRAKSLITARKEVRTEGRKDHNVALMIATGEQRLYANLLLQIGVIFPESAQ